MTPLLQATYALIDQVRGRLDIHQPAGLVSHELAPGQWQTTLEGAQARLIPLPHDEDFSLLVGVWEAGQEAHDFDVPHTLEAWVIRGEFDLRLGDGPWVPMRQGSAYILAPGQCHSLRCHKRAYLVATMCPPLPVSLPPTEHCSNAD